MEYVSATGEAREIATVADLGSGGGGGGDASKILEAQIQAASRQPAKSILAVGYTTSGKVQGVSLGDGNIVEVYANGAAFAAGNVLYRERMSLGEPIIFTGCSLGSIITSTEGFYGASEQVSGGNTSSMPLLSLALSFTQTTFYPHRNAGFNQAFVHVVNGPLASTVEMFDGSGLTSYGTLELDPWEHGFLRPNGSRAYLIRSTNPVMACTHSAMNVPAFYDSRLIMPPASDLIGWPRAGRMTAVDPGTTFDFYARDGVEGSSSVGGTLVRDISALMGSSDPDFEPSGATRVRARGQVSAMSGDDSAGFESVPYQPLGTLAQVVAQPFEISDSGDGGNSGISIASPYAGTARVFHWSGGALALRYTVPLNRSNVSITRYTDQYHPAAGMVANEGDGVSVPLVGTLQPGVIIADVPVMVVAQSDTTGSTWIRKQGSGTTSAISMNDDETLMLGITPEYHRAEVRFDANSILRRRTISSSGAVSWTVA